MTTTEFQSRFDALRPTLFAFAMKLTRNTEDAKDLMQETAFRAFRGLHRFKDGTHFKSWLSTILRNNYINEYRKRRTRNRVEAPIEDFTNFVENVSTSEANPNRRMMMAELKEILANLADGYRIPFMMYFNGYSYDEIAQKMEMPIGTVKSRIFYARKQLKATIKARYGGKVLKAVA